MILTNGIFTVLYIVEKIKSFLLVGKILTLSTAVICVYNYYIQLYDFAILISKCLIKC